MLNCPVRSFFIFQADHKMSLFLWCFMYYNKKQISITLLYDFCLNYIHFLLSIPQDVITNIYKVLKGTVKTICHYILMSFYLLKLQFQNKWIIRKYDTRTKLVNKMMCRDKKLISKLSIHRSLLYNISVQPSSFRTSSLYILKTHDKLK